MDITKLSQEQFLKEVEKREAILREELIGDEVRVRFQNYKKMAKATVGARKRPEYSNQGPEWRISFAYVRASQGQTVSRLRRLDVSTDNGWRTVWDDGLDDFAEWQREAISLPKHPKWRSGTLG
jgi:hypothetical protein